MARKRKKRPQRAPRMNAYDALDLVSDDMPDGAAMAMAAEMAGMDYADFCDALVDDYEGES